MILTFRYHRFQKNSNYQKEAFNRQAAVLTDDLKNVVTNERKKVYLEILQLSILLEFLIYYFSLYSKQI